MNVRMNMVSRRGRIVTRQGRAHLHIKHCLIYTRVSVLEASNASDLPRKKRGVIASVERASGLQQPRPQQQHVYTSEASHFNVPEQRVLFVLSCSSAAVAIS